MEASISLETTSKPIKQSKRFATLDFARGVAIFLMIGLHTLALVLNIPDLLAVIEDHSFSESNYVNNHTFLWGIGWILPSRIIS